MSNRNHQVNIGGDPNDPHYRYKRPVIKVSYTKISTIIENLESIQISLKEPDGFKISFARKVQQKGRGHLGDNTFQGHIERLDLEAYLNEWISENILCPICKAPELTQDKSSCKACSYTKEKPKTKRTRIKSVIADLRSWKQKIIQEFKGYDCHQLKWCEKLIEKLSREIDSDKINKLLLEAHECLNGELPPKHRKWAVGQSEMLKDLYDKRNKCDDKIRKKVDKLINKIWNAENSHEHSMKLLKEYKTLFPGE